MPLKSLKPVLVAAYVLAVLAVVGVAGFAVRGVQATQEASLWSQHTGEVLNQLKGTTALLKTLESAQRGYLLDGNARELEAFHDAAGALTASILRLQVMTADNAQQQARIGWLRESAAARISLAEKVASVRESHGREAAFLIFNSSAGARLSGVVEKSLAEMNAEEDGLLEIREKAAAADSRGTLQLLGGLTVLTLMVLTGAWCLLHRWVHELELKNEEMANLRKLVNDLQACSTVSAALEVVQNHLHALFGAMTAGEIGLLRESRDLVDVASRWGKGDASTEDRYEPGDCCAVKRGGLFWADARGTGLRCGHLGSYSGSYLAYSLFAYGETAGVVHVYCAPDSLRAWTKGRATRFLRTMMEQVAISIAGLKLREALQAQSIHDPLTNAFNRRYMEATLERELSRAQRKKSTVGLILLDLDHFKRINDSYGHQAGDEVLKSLVSLCTRLVRGEDAVCRFGGEEFAIVMPDASEQTVRERAEMIRLGLKQLSIEHQSMVIGPITVSAGTAVSSAAHGKSSVMIKCADARLYRAKQFGRDQVVSNDDPLATAGNAMENFGAIQ